MRQITRLPVRRELVERFHGRGPYTTKSKAQLKVPITLAAHPLGGALDDFEDEIAPLSRRLTRQRVYTVRPTKCGVSADAQMNKRSTKVVSVLSGSLWIAYTDFGAGPLDANLIPLDSIVIPPGITNATRISDPSTVLLVIENMAHDPNSDRLCPKLFQTSQRRTQPHTVEEIEHFRSTEPLVGANGVRLQPYFTLNQLEVERFLSYDQTPVLNIGRAPDYHLPGEQVYTTSGIKAREIGGMHAHCMRQQITVCTRGSVLWAVEDAYRQRTSFVLNEGDGVWLPSDILHSYQGIAPESDILTLANTIYRPENPDSHDECDIEAFIHWQEGFSSRE